MLDLRPRPRGQLAGAHVSSSLVDRASALPFGRALAAMVSARQVRRPRRARASGRAPRSAASMSAIRSPYARGRRRSAAGPMGTDCRTPRCSTGARPGFRRRRARSPASIPACVGAGDGGGLPALEAHRQHAAEAALHLARGDRVSRMRAKPGIEHARDRRMIAEMPGDGHGRGALVAHAHVQGPHAPQQQRGLERAEDAAQHGPQPGRALECRPVAANTIAPATTSECPFRYLVAECRTMSAPSPIGRVSTGVGTVEFDRQQRAGRMGDARRLRDIRDRSTAGWTESRSRRAACCRADCRAQRARIARVDEGRLDAVARRILGQPLAQAPVHGRGRDHVRGPLQARNAAVAAAMPDANIRSLRPPRVRSGRPPPVAPWHCPSGRSSSPVGTGCPHRERRSWPHGSAARSRRWRHPRAPGLRGDRLGLSRQDGPLR